MNWIIVTNYFLLGMMATSLAYAAFLMAKYEYSKRFSKVKDIEIILFDE